MPEKKAQNRQEVLNEIEGGISKWRMLFLRAAWAEEDLPSANSVLPVSKQALVLVLRLHRKAFAFQSIPQATSCFVSHSTGSRPDICFVGRPTLPLPVSPTNSPPNSIVRLYKDDTIIGDGEFRPGYKDHPNLFFECQDGIASYLASKPLLKSGMSCTCSC
jgi:hypothetical protein